LGAQAPLADAVLRIPAGTTGFFLREKDILSPFRMAGESCIEYEVCQAKVLTEGGGLRETQVDNPLSVNHSCA